MPPKLTLKFRFVIPPSSCTTLPSRGPRSADRRATTSVSSGIVNSGFMRATLRRASVTCEALGPPMSDAELILVAAALLAAGIAASLLASRIRLPGLLLFLGVGMLIGSDGTGWIAFDDYE